MAGTASLMDLMRAIVADDAKAVSQLLSASPDLARGALPEGATRQNAKAFRFEVIGHYVYKGDTALHLAAAAYRHQLIGKLLKAGADVHARNYLSCTC